jgi:hypothetical protein
VSQVLRLPAPNARRDRTPWFDGWQSLVGVFAIAGTLAIVAVVFGWRGSDLPAQVFRSELVRRDGFVIWNSQWFGGHPVLTYSVLSPVLGALTGPVALGAITGVASSVVFERILRFAFGRVAWIGALWFALGSVTNLIVGRVTFSLGVMFGLVAVYALQHRRAVVATIAALLCAMSSPLAGVFLALAAAAWAFARPSRRTGALFVLAASLAPIAIVSLLFSPDGTQPYELWALSWDITLSVVLVLTARRYPVLRWGGALYAVAAIGSYVVPTALGGNVSRFSQYVAGPVLACVLWPSRRLLLAVLSVPLLIIQWYPAVDGIAYARTDPSTKESYYAPLIGFLKSQPGPIGRVEIPFTFRHWEAAYAAPHVPLARGWERQLDIAYDPIFYSGPLTEQTYHEWLTKNGVAYVALPDARLDDSSLGERALLETGLPYLELVWHDAHWRVWKVRDFRGLAIGAAELVRLAPKGFTLDVRRPGDVEVRVRANRHWTVHGGGCAAATDDGWTVLRDVRPGVVEVTQSLGGTPCPTP